MKPISIDKLQPALAIHPGSVLQDELNSRKISRKQFAVMTGLNTQAIHRIIHGKKDIDKYLSIIISRALKMDAQIWLNLQDIYEADKRKLHNRK